MNKEISVQYAYKKDGKGERHGDEAERLLAKQAKQHGIQPAMQPLNPALFQPAPVQSMPQGPPIGMGDGRGGPPPSGFAPGYNAVPPPQPHMRGPQAPLPPPPSGLPARPPASHVGPNGPGYIPGFSTVTPPPMQGFPPPQVPGFGPPPQGPQVGVPPGFVPPGFGRR